jgi:hypothetical protein
MTWYRYSLSVGCLTFITHICTFHELKPSLWQSSRHLHPSSSLPSPWPTSLITPLRLSAMPGYFRHGRARPFLIFALSPRRVRSEVCRQLERRRAIMLTIQRCLPAFAYTFYGELAPLLYTTGILPCNRCTLKLSLTLCKTSRSRSKSWTSSHAHQLAIRYPYPQLRLRPPSCRPASSPRKEIDFRRGRDLRRRPR